METLAIRLKELRKEKGYTLEEMAKDLNTTKVTLSRYENGKREPKSEILNQLSDYLFRKTDEKTPKTKDAIIDVKKAIEEIKDELENSNSLMFDGECLSEDAISSLLSAMEIGLSIAKKKQEEMKNK